MGKKSILTQILIYGVISALVVLVDYVTLWLLTEKVGVHYILSAAIGFSLGLPVKNTLYSRKADYKVPQRNLSPTHW